MNLEDKNHSVLLAEEIQITTEQLTKTFFKFTISISFKNTQTAVNQKRYFSCSKEIRVKTTEVKVCSSVLVNFN
jgi:hypothetical protein